MTQGEMLLAMVRFHAWANERILTTARALTDEDFRASGPFDHGTAFDTLRHLADVDWSWRQFLQGNDVGETYVWDHGFVLDDLNSIRTFCLDEDARMLEYVESLDDAALAEPLGSRSIPRALIIAHVVIHGTQHRSELARYLTERGHSPGDLGLPDALGSRA
jgi:uncharacterized damage-inducible protein DinB